MRENYRLYKLYKMVTKSGIDTSDATATANDLLKGKTAYVNGQQILGIIEEYNGFFEGNANKAEENAIIDVNLAQQSNSSGQNFLNQMLKKIPAIDLSNWTYAIEMFRKCTNLTEITLANTQNIESWSSCFSDCSNLLNIPDGIDTSAGKSFYHIFAYCDALTTVNLNKLQTGNGTNFSGMFYACSKLSELIGEIDTSNATELINAFANCSELKNLPKLNTGKCINIRDVIHYTSTASLKIETIGGFVDLGKAYTRTTINYPSYELKLYKCPKLTHESLMNVINNLYDLNLTYDIANGGILYTQALTLGDVNIAKLTAEEIAIATNKGWSVS